jgi:hypothetical protein
MFHQSFAQEPEVSTEEKIVQPLVIELNDEDLTQVNGSWGWGGLGWGGWGWGGLGCCCCFCCCCCCW